MRRFSLDRFLSRAVMPTGFGLLVYSLAVDRFRNPGIFSGAITLITLPIMRAATQPKQNGK